MINPVPPNPFVVGNVETARVDVRRLAGIVKDANGNAIAGVTVYAYDRDTDQLAGRAVTGTDGSWSMSVNNVPQGYYAVWYMKGLAVTTGTMVGPLFTS